jgi:predicted solute-binding protein
MTGLPFVWAFWSGREAAITPATVRRLQAAAEQGTADLDAIASAYCRDAPERGPIARRYLRDNMRYHFGPREVEGVRTYFREVAALGLATAGTREPVFFDAD